MTTSIRDVMTPDPIALSADTPISQAAEEMKRQDIGDVIVMDHDQLCGVVTDRDIVVRAIAEHRDPEQTKLGAICSSDVVTLSPSDTVDDAVRLMRDRALRRLPVVEGQTPVGIVSIGDLAIERDPASALADISAAPGNE